MLYPYILILGTIRTMVYGLVSRGSVKNDATLRSPDSFTGNHTPGS